MTMIVDPVSAEPAQAARMIRAEFHEMPGLCLTLAQAARLWHLPEVHCRAMLDDLVSTGFLVRDRTNRYARRSDAH